MSVFGAANNRNSNASSVITGTSANAVSSANPCSPATFCVPSIAKRSLSLARAAATYPSGSGDNEPEFETRSSLRMLEAEIL